MHESAEQGQGRYDPTTDGMEFQPLSEIPAKADETGRMYMLHSSSTDNSVSSGPAPNDSTKRTQSLSLCILKDAAKELMQEALLGHEIGFSEAIRKDGGSNLTKGGFSDLPPDQCASCAVGQTTQIVTG